MFKKIFRDIRIDKVWFIVIVIFIALSAGIYSSFRSTYDSAVSSVDRANDKLQTSDIVVSVAPSADISEDMSKVSGIYKVSPTFSMDTYTVFNGKRVRGQVSSVEPKNRVNSYQIIKGRDIDNKDDIVVEHHYAASHNVAPGDDILLYLNGKVDRFHVSGIYFSPDNLYMVSPEGWIEKDFGYFHVIKGSLGNYINQYQIKTSNGYNKNKAHDNLEKWLADRQINAIVMVTDKMLSRTAFQEDASALNSLANIFTLILLFVSAVVFFIFLSRQVERKRREIGVYRAMGFSKWSVFSYFICFASIVVVFGIILSLPIAFGLLVYIIQYWGINIMKVPNDFLAYHLGVHYIVYSALFSLVAVIFSAAIPAWRAASLKPVDALKGYIVSTKSSRILSKRAANVHFKVIFRNIFGHKLKSVSTIVGIAFIFAIGLSFILSIDSFIVGINSRFSKNEHWDIRVNFTNKGDFETLSRLKAIDGVKEVEPFAGSSAEIKKRDKSVVVQYNEMIPSTKMSSFSLISGSVAMGGIILSGDVAQRLHIKTGESVSISTAEGKSNQTVAGIFNEFGSSEAYLLHNIQVPTGALVTIESSKFDLVEKSLENMPSIKSWVRKEEFKKGWLTMFNEFQGMTYAMDAITMVLTLLLMGIFAFLSVSERRWNMVILKLMGFSNHKIRFEMILENVFLTSVGILLGIPIGMYIATAFNDTFGDIMSPPPVIFSTEPILIRSFLVISVTIITVYIVVTADLRKNVIDKVRRLFGTI